MSYQIPVSLREEIDELESSIEKYRAGALDAASLKARRVPFGCYEQRKDGTYMVRVRTTGGALTPAQLRALALVCDKYGSDTIHITTRQEFQVHEVSIDNVIAVMRELLSAGLSSRGGGGNTVRNIMISPDAGVSPEEVFDPSPYAFALTSRLISEADSWVLPRKLKITFSNSGKDTAGHKRPCGIRERLQVVQESRQDWNPSSGVLGPHASDGDRTATLDEPFCQPVLTNC
jgi:sulfite reductase (ferredoxin)